jgi:hypothetical protein
MIWHFPSQSGGRAARLVAGGGAALLACVWLAPVVGGEAPVTTRAWTIQPSPDPSGALASGLAAVSCSGSNWCVAVGASSYPSGHQIPNQKALVEQFSSGRWTIASTPAIAGATSTSLSDVSCPGADFCVAVGSAQFAGPHPSPVPLAEMWNGTSWSDGMLPVPSGGSEPALTAVSCATPGVCVAVGNYIDDKSDTYRPLAEQLGDSVWAMVQTPVPPIGGGTIANSELTDIACPSLVSCEAVGDVTYNDTLQKVFAYGFNGSTWSYQPQVNPGPDPGSTDGAVSCTRAKACTSVGWVNIIGEIALAEYWDGSTWVDQVTPSPVHRPDDALYDVSCDGGASCVAVGESYRVDQTNGHLIDGRVMGETWDGTTWSQTPPVVPSGLSANLEGISCPSPTSCVAVGDTSTPSSTSTLVEAFAH